MATDELDLSEFGSEEDLAGFAYPKPGRYHAVVLKMDASREKVFGLKVGFQVLAGTVAGQVNKQFEEVFWDPADTDKDRGAFARKKRARLALATGLVKLTDLGSRPQIDWDQLVGRQCVVDVREREWTSKDGTKKGKQAEIDGLGIYSVLDVEVLGIVPMDAEALEMIGVKLPANGAAGPAPPAASGAGKAKSPTRERGTKPQPAPAPAPAEDFSDL